MMFDSPLPYLQYLVDIVLKNLRALLLQLINEKPQIIQEYESGKAIPNQQIIGKLERTLGVKLRGKK